jgi:hypothetical protein
MSWLSEILHGRKPKPLEEAARAVVELRADFEKFKAALSGLGETAECDAVKAAAADLEYDVALLYAVIKGK